MYGASGGKQTLRVMNKYSERNSIM